MVVGRQFNNLLYQINVGKWLQSGWISGQSAPPSNPPMAAAMTINQKISFWPCAPLLTEMTVHQKWGKISALKHPAV
jgi:hypothetical protein